MSNTKTLLPAKNRTFKSKTRTLFILFCITIPIAHWLIFYVYVNFNSITMAFLDRNGALSLANFSRFFSEITTQSSELKLAFQNTLITFILLLITFPFKILVSYFIYKKIPGHKFFRNVFFLPAIIFPVAISLIFIRMVGTDGTIAQTVGSLMGLSYVPELLADSRFANITVLLNMLWLAFPGDLIIWGGTFARIPDDVYEAGKIDGVGWFREFTHLTVPLVWPTVSLQMILLFCGFFAASGNVFLLTSGQYGTMTITAWMYLTLFRNSGGIDTSNVFNYLSAVGFVLTLVSIAVSLVIRKFTNRIFNDVEY